MSQTKKIRVLGGGWYGCHIARSLLQDDHDVVLHEIRPELFGGASGNQPARLHLGFHYPRSRLTRAACQDHYRRFMNTYGNLTAGVPLNIYAIAEDHSLVDFGNYVQTLQEEVDFVRVEKPAEFGLQNVEGALLTGERHVVIRKAKAFFEDVLAGIVEYEVPPTAYDESEFDLTIDCTFCAREATNVDRYEPCLTALLHGPTDAAITIMDGPFPSLYPWDEEKGLCSLTSAKLTPLRKDCRTYDEAMSVIRAATYTETMRLHRAMVEQMEHYFPRVATEYVSAGYKLAVRAMPLSGADARLVDIVKTGEKTLRVRASKLDAIFYAEDVVKEALRQ